MIITIAQTERHIMNNEQPNTLKFETGTMNKAFHISTGLETLDSLSLLITTISMQYHKYHSLTNRC